MSGRRPDVDTGQCRPLASPAPSRPFSVSSLHGAAGAVATRQTHAGQARAGPRLRGASDGGRHEIDRSPRARHGGSCARARCAGAGRRCLQRRRQQHRRFALHGDGGERRNHGDDGAHHNTAGHHGCSNRSDRGDDGRIDEHHRAAADHDDARGQARLLRGVADRRAVHRRARTQRGRPGRGRSRRGDHRRGVLGRVQPGTASRSSRRRAR